VKGCVILYQWTTGSPMGVLPRSSVPLFAARIAVAVPVRFTYAGAVPAPEETARSPWRAPGCEGAKDRTTEHEAPAERTLGQLVESVKSPVSERLSGKGWVPVLVTMAVGEFAEVVVTTTGLEKLRVVGVTTRFGLTVEPLAPGCGIICPVMWTLAP